MEKLYQQQALYHHVDPLSYACSLNSTLFPTIHAVTVMTFLPAQLIRCSEVGFVVVGVGGGGGIQSSFCFERCRGFERCFRFG